MRGAPSRVIRVTAAPGRQKHLLDHLFRLAHVAQHAVRQADRLSVVRVIQRLERRQGRRRRRLAHETTGAANNGVLVGAFTPGATSCVMATVVPTTWPLSGRSAW